LKAETNIQTAEKEEKKNGWRAKLSRLEVVACK
jgi:hypothetical protein